MTPRRPRPPSTWRIQEHCRSHTCTWVTVRYVGRPVRNFRRHEDAMTYIAAHPHGPDRETT